MPNLTDKDIAVLNGAMANYEPVFFSGKGYERDTLVGTSQDGAIALTIENPWAGNSGYGTRSRYSLTVEEARNLASWLLGAVREHGAP